MKVILTEESIQWLESRRIYFDFKGRRRLRPGNRIRFESDLAVEPYVGFFDGFRLCRMGLMSYSMSPVQAGLTIGRYCSIGRGVDVILDHHPIDHVSTALVTQASHGLLPQQLAQDLGIELPAGSPFEERAAPVIENDVWIGAHVRVLPGVRIGTGSVVGAGSVVTRDVGPYEVVGGSPARLIRRRFPDELIAALSQTEWWRYNLADFRDLPFEDPAKFATAFLKRKSELEPYLPESILLAEMPR